MLDPKACCNNCYGKEGIVPCVVECYKILILDNAKMSMGINHYTRLTICFMQTVDVCVIRM